MSNARSIAVDILYKINVQNAYSNIVLNKVLKKSELSALDVAFCSALVYGVLERKITLDYIISCYSKTPVEKIDKTVLIILETAIFQLLYMDKIPESAVVNEAVNLSVKHRKIKVKSFINAILRNFLRNDKKYNLPPIKSKVKYLSVKYSMPEEIVRLWLNNYSDIVTEKLLASFIGRPPIVIRVNTNLCTKEELKEKLTLKNIEVQEIEVLENALILSKTGAIENLEEFKQGLFFVQDSGSQILCKLINPQKDNIITDVCAAPGGKTFNLSLMMKNTGKVYSYDLYEHKVKLIEETASRLKLENVVAIVSDATNCKDYNASDVILCDVPCSGLGILKRKPEIRYKEDLGYKTLPNIQYEILCNCKDKVKKGGLLIYSTCTLNRAENNNITKKFLKENEEFEPYKLNLPNGIKREIKESENEITLLPFVHESDGFYISVFKKV